MPQQKFRKFAMRMNKCCLAVIYGIPQQISSPEVTGIFDGTRVSIFDTFQKCGTCGILKLDRTASRQFFDRDDPLEDIPVFKYAGKDPERPVLHDFSQQTVGQSDTGNILVYHKCFGIVIADCLTHFFSGILWAAARRENT